MRINLRRYDPPVWEEKILESASETVLGAKEMVAFHWFAKHALNELWTQTDGMQDTEDGPQPCCPMCCGPCHGLALLLNSGHLDVVAGQGNGNEPGDAWWDHVQERVDRTWLERALAVCDLHATPSQSPTQERNPRMQRFTLTVEIAGDAGLLESPSMVAIYALQDVVRGIHANPRPDQVPRKISDANGERLGRYTFGLTEGSSE